MAGTTIDNFDIGVYLNYARRTQYIEQIRKEYRLQEASAIPPQTYVTGFQPIATELERLLGVMKTYAPWAYFLPPQKFKYRRRSPFSFYRVAPSLGTLQEQENDKKLIAALVCETPEEEFEKKTILNFFEETEHLNELINYINGRIGGILPG